MKMKLTLPSDLEVENVKFDGKARVLELDLIFYGKGNEATAGVLQTLNKDGLTHGVSILKVSGKTGKPQLQDRSARVVPPIEQGDAPPVQATPAEEDPLTA